MGTWLMTHTKSGIRVRYRSEKQDLDKLGDVTPETPPAKIADWILVHAETGDVIVLSDGSQLQKLPAALA